MLDVVDNNAAYYYHYDGLGSVVALSDSDADTVQTYEYSVYGQVAASTNFLTNPYMFTGRRFDIETGLYYYRARYYNPHIGRFMQTDPVGDGMNLYAYCGNNPTGRVDPSGLYYLFLDRESENDPLRFAWVDDKGVEVIFTCQTLTTWALWAEDNNTRFPDSWKEEQPGWELSRTWINDTNEPFSQNDFFWSLQALMFLNEGGMIDAIEEIEEKMGNGRNINIVYGDQWSDEFGFGYNGYAVRGDTITLYWNPTWTQLGSKKPVDKLAREWYNFPALAGLAHELSHGRDFLIRQMYSPAWTEIMAMSAENEVRWAFFNKVPGSGHILPRPGYCRHWFDIAWSNYPNWRPLYKCPRCR